MAEPGSPVLLGGGTATRRLFLRRVALASTAAAGAGVLAACRPAGPSPAAAPTSTAPGAAPASATGSTFDWARFSGTKLRFMNNTHDWSTDIVPKALPEFEKLTGMKVGWEVLPENEFRQKLTLELQSRPESVDGYMSLTSWDGEAFAKNGWYEPIETYTQSTELTTPEFDLQDFFPNTLKIATVHGTLIGVPLYPEVQLLYSNAPLLQEKSAKVPETLDEFVAAAEQLTDRSKNVAGYVSRGDGIQAVYTLAPFIFALGGGWLDENGRPALTSDAFVRALDLYGSTLRKFGPPGIAGMQWSQTTVLFDQGNAALFTDSSNFVSTFEDPQKSKLAGKVGYAMLPKGPAGVRSTLISWSLSICSRSRNKEATWYFIQWLAGKEMVARQAKARIPVARQSVWNGRDFQAQMPKAWLDNFAAELPTAAVNQANPNVVPVPEVRDALGKAIVTVIQGGDAREAAQAAQQKALQILNLA